MTNFFIKLSSHPGSDGANMKHHDGRYGDIKLEDTLKKQINIHLHPNDGDKRYQSIEDEVEAGWAID